MTAPRDVLVQLLSPAQAGTLESAASTGWHVSAQALAAFLGSVPGVGRVDGRLVMPDEIVGDYDGPHLVLPVGITTDRDESATAYVTVPTSDAASFFVTAADDAAEQEQQTMVMAGTLFNQVVRALNQALAAGSQSGLAFAAEDPAANVMPGLLLEMDEPALALTAIIQADRTLPFALILPGTFLDVLAGAVRVAALPGSNPSARGVPASAPTAGLESPLGFTLTEDDLAGAALIDGLDRSEPHPALVGAGARAGAGREPRPITQGPAANRARFAPLPDPPAPHAGRNGMDVLAGLRMNVTVELGRTELTVADVLALGPGSVIELDRLAGEPVDILINERLVARGEVVVVDENFGIRVVEVVRRRPGSEDQD